MAKNAELSVSLVLRVIDVACQSSSFVGRLLREQDAVAASLDHPERLRHFSLTATASICIIGAVADPTLVAHTVATCSN